MTSTTDNERVVMTSYRHNNVATISVKRVPEEEIDKSAIYYEASGQHTGLVVNNKGDASELTGTPEPEMQLEFTCIMFNKKTQETHAENRRLKFWFKKDTDQMKRLDGSYEFFKELINPSSFPKDYVGFIKKVMKQLQSNRFQHLHRVDVDLITLNKGEQEALVPEKDPRSQDEILMETLQQRLDEAFPNVISMDDLVNLLNVDVQKIETLLKELETKSSVQRISLEGKNKGKIAYRRNYPQVENEKVEVMNEDHQIRRIATDEKPTIAVITNLMCEKMAVDAMMTQKTTFVKYSTKTEGESHVYSIGYIGKHKVISTKLPMVGRLMKEKISSGGNTTRLLGTFQNIEHVFIVGVGGGVPHVYEFEKHSRLGDVVVSQTRQQPTTDSVPSGVSTAFVNGSSAPGAGAASATDYMYVFCDRVILPDPDTQPAPPQQQQSSHDNSAPIQYLLKFYKPRDNQLSVLASQLLANHEQAVLSGGSQSPPAWLGYMDEALEKHLGPGGDSSSSTSITTTKLAGNSANAAGGGEIDFRRPAPETDKLKIRMGGGMTFDIRPPEPSVERAHVQPVGRPAVRLGCIGSGRPITDNDEMRDAFAHEYSLLAWDQEYDQVLESIMGNQVHSYLFIRGIADYVDGARGSQWQPYAALAAAGFMKAVITSL